ERYLSGFLKRRCDAGIALFVCGGLRSAVKVEVVDSATARVDCPDPGTPVRLLERTHIPERKNVAACRKPDLPVDVRTLCGCASFAAVILTASRAVGVVVQVIECHLWDDDPHALEHRVREKLHLPVVSAAIE